MVKPERKEDLAERNRVLALVMVRINIIICLLKFMKCVTYVELSKYRFLEVSVGQVERALKRTLFNC